MKHGRLIFLTVQFALLAALPTPSLAQTPAQEAAPEATDAEAAAPAGMAEPPSLVAPRTERSDRGDRGEEGSRGRRSRRRRNRGRGFPDSKYASEVSRPPRIPEAAPAVESTTAIPAAPSATPVSAGPTDFSVLPGESLAKYTRSNIQPLDDAEEEEIRDLQETAAPAPEPQTAAQLLEEEIAEVAEEAEEEPDDAPIAQDTVTAEPEALEVEALDTEELDEVEESTSEVENESGVEVSAESAAVETPGEAGSEVPPSAAAPLSAQVREQGGRYMHRLPRRMRRKMRGGGQIEGRPEGRGEARTIDEPRGEGAATEPAAAGRPEQRPEPRTFSRPEKAPLPSITELLKEGQEIIVQIAKEPLGQKGARITSHIALPGRYVVYMPTLEHTGVSRKIASDEERLRLKRILQVHHAGIPGGFIVRTAGEGKSEEDLAADMNFLFNLWLDIRQKAEKKPAPLLLHHDLDIVQRTLRDQLTED